MNHKPPWSYHFFLMTMIREIFLEYTALICNRNDLHSVCLHSLRSGRGFCCFKQNNGVSEKVKVSDINVETTQHTLFLLYKSSDLYEVLEDQIETKWLSINSCLNLAHKDHYECFVLTRSYSHRWKNWTLSKRYRTIMKGILYKDVFLFFFDIITNL